MTATVTVLLDGPENGSQVSVSGKQIPVALISCFSQTSPEIAKSTKLQQNCSSIKLEAGERSNSQSDACDLKIATLTRRNVQKNTKNRSAISALKLGAEIVHQGHWRREGLNRTGYAVRNVTSSSSAHQSRNGLHGVRRKGFINSRTFYRIVHCNTRAFAWFVV